MYVLLWIFFSVFRKLFFLTENSLVQCAPFGFNPDAEEEDDFGSMNRPVSVMSAASSVASKLGTTANVR